MRSREIREVVSGGVAILVLLAILGIFYSGQHQRAKAGLTEYTVYATFNRIDGLDVGTDVQLSGIPIGTVEQVSLTSNYRARVTMLLRRDVALPTDTSAAIHTDGLFGSKFVTLEPGGAEDFLKEGDTITFTQDAVVVSDLLDLIIAEGKARRSGAAAESEDAEDGAAEDSETGGK